MNSLLWSLTINTRHCHHCIARLFLKVKSLSSPKRTKEPLGHQRRTRPKTQCECWPLLVSCMILSKLLNLLASMFFTVEKNWKLVAQSCSTLCNPMDYIACQAPLSTGFSRREYWRGCHSLLQGIFPTYGLNPGFLHCRQMLYCLSH